jgi:hypothetical protein
MPQGKPVERKETLARFSVFNDWTLKDGTPKVDLFMPDRSLTVSVFRSDGLSKGQLKRINNEVDLARRKKLVNYGYCPVNAGNVMDNGFPLDPNDEPKHHVNIKGFGADASTHRAEALKLAQIAGKLTDAHLK